MGRMDLKSQLSPHAAAWVREVRVFDVVGSTNDILKEAARGGAPEGTVVIAARQTGGRGRQGRAWSSPEGNLFFSILLRPRPACALSLLPLAAGVAVAEALAEKGASCRLKWPNDVLARDRKLAGLLAEASSDAGRIDSVVLGIGVNVNADLATLPEEIRAHATSLAAESGRVCAPEEVAAAVLERWVVWYDALVREAASVRQAWRARSVDWWGHPVAVTSGGQRLSGIARDLDETGALVLEMSDGSRRTIVSGDAEALRAGPAL